MNHFYKFWNDATNGNSEFVPYEIAWDDVPGRDDAFRRKVIGEFGKEYWSQEFECEFIGSAGTLIEGWKLKALSHDNPVDERLDYKLKVYSLPEKDHAYVAIFDTGEGVGLDSSVVQVFDVTSRPYAQVATYRNNRISIRDFPVVVEKIGLLYNEALVIGESNTIGEAVLNDLIYDLEYENVFYDDDFGIHMSKKTKSYGNSNLKTNIEDDHFRVRDLDTIKELTTYARKGNSYEAEANKHDDTVTPLVIFSYFLRNKLWIENWLDQEREGVNKAMIKKMEEDLLPVGFVSNGESEHRIGSSGGFSDFF
jgi:hypothetical protein